MRASRKFASSSKAITQTKDLQVPTSRQPKTYEATDHGLIRWEFQKGEWTPIQIANFTARVIEDLTVDDGVDIGHEYRIEAVLNGGKLTDTVDVTSMKFDRMNWTGKLGIGAIINAGCERHVRAAIKYLSIGQYTTRNVYRHTGWRKVGGRMLYLHAGGAIAKTGAIRTVETKLSKNLSDFVLPAPPRTLSRLTEVIAALLGFLDAAPDRITVPLLSAMCRSVLGEVNITIHMTARHGSGKSELAALIQQCFGPKMDANSSNKIPWSSTENFLEQMAFEAKDAVLRIDDFKPNGTPQQKQEWHAKADRVIRAQGNRAGKGRLNSDLETIGSKAPRGLILSTGEETPYGASLQARMVILEFAPDEINTKALTQCQQDARDGLYAEAAAAFIRWLPDHLDKMSSLVFEELNRYRHVFHGTSKGLKRSPDNIFQLAIAFRVFLSFAVQMNALTLEKAQLLWRRATVAYREAMRMAQVQQSISDPETRFFELVHSLISSGAGHIAGGKTGGSPSKAESLWGWKQREDGRPGLQPQGICFGWLHREGLYLQETIIWPEVRNLAERCNERFDISFTQLKRQLFQRKLLVTCDIDNPQRRCFTVRKTCAGKMRELLHVAPKTLLGGEGGRFADKSDKSTAPEAGWEKMSDFTPFYVGKQRANRHILSPLESMPPSQNVGNVGKLGGGTPKSRKAPRANMSDSMSDAQNLPTKTTTESDRNGHCGDEWQRAGFVSAEEFTAWYETIYASHPTRGKLNEARELLAELVADGTLQREAFETGYAAHRNSAAWEREGGRYIPKLSTFIQDRGWMFPPVEPPKAAQNGTEPHPSSKHHAAAAGHQTAAERRAERLKNL